MKFIDDSLAYPMAIVILLAGIGAYALLLSLLLTRVKDGFTYAPLLGLGLGYIIGTAIADLFGFDRYLLGDLLALALAIGPPLVVFVARRRQANKARARPTPAELDRLEREVDWTPYDPGWLVALAREQRPEERALHEALDACTKCVESNGRTCFVNPVLITDAATVRTFLRTGNGDAVLIYYLPWDGIAAIGHGRFPAQAAPGSD